MTGRRWAMVGAAVAAVALGALVLVRVPDPGNPPVVLEPRWDSPQTRALAVRACFDCHSNETVWPFYASIAPFSWVVRNHVAEARHELNFSEWNREHEEADEAAQLVREGEMPLPSYVWLHPEARLSGEERAALIAGLERTLGTEHAPVPAAGGEAVPAPHDGDGEEFFEHRPAEANEPN